MALVFLPDVEALFLWGDEPAPRVFPTLAVEGQPWSTSLATADGVREVGGTKLSLLATMAKLAVVPAAEVETLPGSFATWVVASKLAMDLVARERVVPTITRRAGRIEARWAAALAAGEDAAKVTAIARSMPPAAHAVPAGTDAVWAPDALLRAYLDALVDALVRAAQGGQACPKRRRRRELHRGIGPRGMSGGGRRSVHRSGASRPTASPNVPSSMISPAGASRRWARAIACVRASGWSCCQATASRSRCGSCCSRPTIRASSSPPPRCGRRRGAASRSSGVRSAIRKSRCSRRSGVRRGSTHRSQVRSPTRAPSRSRSTQRRWPRASRPVRALGGGGRGLRR